MAKTLTSGQHSWVVANRLKVDPRFQRVLNPRKVAQIAKDFDPDALGVVYVSKRADGDHIILDGQTRVAAVKRMGWGDQKIPVHLYLGLSLEEEARLFVEFNELRTKPKPLEIHRAEVVAGDASAVGVERVLEKHNLRLATGPSPGSITAIGAVRTVYDRGGADTLDETLDILIRAWGNDTSSFQGEMLQAVALMTVRFGVHLDRDRLLKVLNRNNPTALLQRARMIKAELEVGSASRLAATVAKVILSQYNVRNRRALMWDDNYSGRTFWQPQTSGHSQAEEGLGDDQ